MELGHIKKGLCSSSPPWPLPPPPQKKKRKKGNFCSPVSTLQNTVALYSEFPANIQLTLLNHGKGKQRQSGEGH